MIYEVRDEPDDLPIICASEVEAAAARAVEPHASASPC